MGTDDISLAHETDLQEEARQPESGGFMKFYGLFWKKNAFLEHCGIDQSNNSNEFLLGSPAGWTGRGRPGQTFNHNRLWMNFWAQKGVYVLYDEQLTPVYVGQAGLTRKKKSLGRNLGERLRDHTIGKYRNGWVFFSWFGFLEPERETELRGYLRSSRLDARLDPKFGFKASSDGEELNNLLDSFEAILIEAFTPRFNSRGGNLKGSVYVDQFEGKPAME